MPWAARLATPVAGIWRQEEGCGNPMMNGYQLANRAIYICGAAHISQSASTLNSVDTNMNLNFLQREMKDRQVHVIHRIFRKYQSSGEDVNVCVCACVCVCVVCVCVVCVCMCGVCVCGVCV